LCIDYYGLFGQCLIPCVEPIHYTHTPTFPVTDIVIPLCGPVTRLVDYDSHDPLLTGNLFIVTAPVLQLPPPHYSIVEDPDLQLLQTDGCTAPLPIADCYLPTFDFIHTFPTYGQFPGYTPTIWYYPDYGYSYICCYLPSIYTHLPVVYRFPHLHDLLFPLLCYLLIPVTLPGT